MPARPLEASIVVIGDEILGGFVQDTNSGWLASRLQAYGVPLTRIVTVPDDAAEIDHALQSELARGRPRLIITTGGIGSTPDDLTYEAIAASLGRRLVVAPEIAAGIDGAVVWTRQFGLEVDEEFVDHMMRMARVPGDSRLLPRSGGWVPGVRVDVDGGMDTVDGATILILPGVPSELRSIVTGVVEPDMLAGRGQPQAVSELVHGFPESVLNTCFARLGRRYPAVKIGSYPGVPMRVRLRGRPEQVMSAYAELEAYVRALEADPGGARLREEWARRTGAVERERVVPGTGRRPGRVGNEETGRRPGRVGNEETGRRAEPSDQIAREGLQARVCGTNRDEESEKEGV